MRRVASRSSVLLVLVLTTAQCRRVDVYAVTQARAVEAGVAETEPLPVSTAPEDTAASTSVEESSTTNGSTRDDTSTASDSSFSSDSKGNEESSSVTSDATAPPVAICPEPQLSPGDTKVTIDVGSLARSYVLHVPENYDPSVPAPVIIDFHGAGGSGQDQLATSTYPEVTDPEGVVMAFPDGVNGPIGTAWNFGPCCVPGVDDLAFVDALVADLRQRVCVDATRVYAVGVLTGGGLVHRMACERSQTFAAISPAAFDLVQETVDECQPEVPISVVAFRGTADPKVPYEGGSSMLVPNMSVTFLGAVNSFDRWASINACTGEPVPVGVDGCQAYTACEDEVEVVLCTKQEGREEAGDAKVAWPILKRHVRSE